MPEPKPRGRLLLVAVSYYGYTDHIRAAFSRLGYDVDYYPFEYVSLKDKLFKKMAPGAYRKSVARHHRNIVARSAERHYDHVVFIQCHRFSLENTAAIRAAHPNANFVLYNWDSLKTHDYRPWMPFFDKVSTFDPIDAAQLGVDYLPLFAVRDFYEVDHMRQKDYDLYFVGALATLDRLDALARLHDYCETNRIRMKFHLHVNPANLLKWGKLFSLPGLTHRSIPFQGIIDLLERSRGVFDFPNHKQSGYTMRFIENIAAGKKIVTSNARVLDESFYTDDRFLVVNDFDFSGIKAFLDRPITSDLDTEQFSIDSWAGRLLEMTRSSSPAPAPAPSRTASAVT